MRLLVTLVRLQLHLLGVRGFSGVSKVESVGNAEFLTFYESEAIGLIATSVGVNLNFEFLGQFYNKFKTQFLPGVERRKFADGLSVARLFWWRFVREVELASSDNCNLR